MLEVRLGTAPGVCRNCFLNRFGQDPRLGGVGPEEIVIACEEYPCDKITEPSKKRC